MGSLYKFTLFYLNLTFWRGKFNKSEENRVDFFAKSNITNQL